MKSKDIIVPPVSLHSLSTENLAMLGADQVAYIRIHEVKSEVIYVVHGANGQELAAFDNHASALAACHDNELETVALQ